MQLGIVAGVAALLAVIAGISLWGWLRGAPAAVRIVTHFTTPLPEETGGPIQTRRRCPAMNRVALRERP